MAFVLTKDNSAQLLKEDLAVVKVSTPGCGPCALMEPRFKVALETFPMPRYNLCAKEHRDLAVEMGIRSAPTFLLYKKGKCVATLVGTHTQTVMTHWLKDNK